MGFEVAAYLANVEKYRITQHPIAPTCWRWCSHVSTTLWIREPQTSPMRVSHGAGDPARRDEALPNVGFRIASA
jgi:acyl-coenzyme A synthetase/AMP-(fatty) acid ligase